MASARGARRAGGGPRLAAVRAGDAPSTRRCGGRPTTSHALAGGDVVELRRARPSSCRPRSRTSSATLFADAPTPRPLDGVGPVPRRGGARAGRSSSSPRRCSGSSEPGLPRRRSRSCAPRSRPSGSRSRRRSRRSGVPVALRGPGRAPDDGVRPRAALAAPLRVARTASGPSSTPTCARRTRASRAGTSTGSRDACAVVGSAGATARSEVTVELRDGRPPAAARRSSWKSRPRSTPSARLPRPMLRNAHGTIGTAPRRRARGSTSRPTTPWPATLDELEALGGGRTEHLPRRRARRARARDRARRARRGAGAGRRARPAARPHATLRHRLRARARAGDASAPRRASSRSSTTRRGARSTSAAARGSIRPDAASRDRYLFATACSRPRRRLVLVRQAVGDEGSPREPSPFWEARAGAVRPRRRPAARRSGARSRRSRASSRLPRPSASACARSPRSPRRAPREASGARARERLGPAARPGDHAFDRPTAADARACAPPRSASREAFSVSELERMASCSSAWFVERYLRPATIDKEIDRMMRGSILHAALQRFYQQLPSAIPGAERVTEENVEAAVALMHDCVAQAVETGLRIDAGDLDRRELEQGLRRDLEQLVRDEAASPSPFVPRHLEVSFRSFELEPGVVVSGKIDRVDGDPMGARGIVIDYKSGAALLGGRDPRARPPPAAALHARAARPARARADGRGLHAGRRRPPAARDAARQERRRSRLQPRDYLEPDEFDAAIDTRACHGGRARRADPARATSGTTRRAANARTGATSGASAARSDREAARRTTQQQAAIDARGTVFVAAGAGTGKTAVLVERFVTRRRRRRPRRRVAARDHVHRARGRRAARAHPRAPPRARSGPTSRSSSTAPGSRRSTASAAGCSARIRSPPGVDPGFRVLDEPQALVLQAEAFTPRSSGSAPPTSPIAGSCSRPTARPGCARCSSRSTRRCARPAGSSCSSRARAAAARRAASTRCARRRAASLDDARATERSVARRQAAARPARRDRPCRSGCSPSTS